MKHASDSTEQQSAEAFILDSLSTELGIELTQGKLSLPSGSSVQIDGINKQEMVLCEIYARIGKLKGSQPDKVASDFIKMLLVEKSLGGNWKKHFCFASDESASILNGKSWLANAAVEFGINVHVYTLPEHIASSVVSAQKRQVMVNK